MKDIIKMLNDDEQNTEVLSNDAEIVDSKQEQQEVSIPKAFKGHMTDCGYA